MFFFVKKTSMDELKEEIQQLKTARSVFGNVSQALL